MKINIAICDDNEVFIRQLKEMIKKIRIADINSYNIYSFISGKKLLEKMKNHFIPDIIFLDIDLHEDNLGTNYGIEFKKINPNILLIYISVYTDYYKEMVHAEPFGFIQKPIDYSELEHVLNSSVKRIQYLKQDYIYTYKTKNATHKIHLKDVIYFESQHRIINILMTTGETIQFYEKLDNIEKDIEERCFYFLRINKSYYINHNYVEHFSDRHVVVNGLQLTISKKYEEKLREKMILL